MDQRVSESLPWGDVYMGLSARLLTCCRLSIQMEAVWAEGKYPRHRSQWDTHVEQQRLFYVMFYGM